MNTNMKCWICGREADSREHRVKRSDLINLHGKGPYKQKNSLVLVKDGKEILIQGPNSNHIKYKKSLCQKCNNSSTQKFDSSYSKFIDYIHHNEKTIIQNRLINLKHLYGNEFAVEQKNLYKYFVKSLGCRIIDTGRKIPNNLLKLLTNNQLYKTDLFITFAINQDRVLLLKDNVRSVGNGALIWSEEIDAFGDFSAQYDEHYSTIHFFYSYNCNWYGREGNRWAADSKCIRLSSFSPLSPEARDEMTQKINKSQQSPHPY